jgi:hypothetical protein
MNIDTLSIARDLKAAELPASQAEAIAAAIGSSARGTLEDAATKADIAHLEAKLEGAATRSDVAHLETKLEAVQVKLIMWFIGTQLAFVAIVGAMIKF